MSQAETHFSILFLTLICLPSPFPVTGGLLRAPQRVSPCGPGLILLVSGHPYSQGSGLWSSVKSRRCNQFTGGKRGAQGRGLPSTGELGWPVSPQIAHFLETTTMGGESEPATRAADSSLARLGPSDCLETRNKEAQILGCPHVPSTGPAPYICIFSLQRHKSWAG